MTWTTCSWCHAPNPTSQQYCSTCSHEAHVARMECRCPACEGEKEDETDQDGLTERGVPY